MSHPNSQGPVFRLLHRVKYTTEILRALNNNVVLYVYVSFHPQQSALTLHHADIQQFFRIISLEFDVRLYHSNDFIYCFFFGSSCCHVIKWH